MAYWDSAEKNQTAITQSVEAAMALIRNRVHFYPFSKASNEHRFRVDMFSCLGTIEITVATADPTGQWRSLASAARPPRYFTRLSVGKVEQQYGRD
ncbi:MAG: hypothetical protein JWQ69_4859 [Pseudomonas sp.]|nr:hypothetical protein [Pseudomonas sp.]